MSLRVGVSLLVCNQQCHPEHLRATQYAVQSLLASDLHQYDWAIQIVDNGSTCPETQAWLKQVNDNDEAWLEELDEINEREDIDEGRLVADMMGENVGIARGRNHSYKLLAPFGCDYVVEIHTDHLFPAVWLTPLIAHLQACPRLGILGPALLTGRPMGWALEYVPVDYSLPYAATMGLVETAAARHRNPERFSLGLTHPAVKRWAMMEELGGYDEHMPGLTNWEDTEEAYRAVCAGWEIGIDFWSVVFHHYTFNRTQVVPDHCGDYLANKQYCEHKHGPGFVAFVRTLGEQMDAAYRGEAK